VDFIEPLEQVGTLQLVNGLGQILEVKEVESGAVRQQIDLTGLVNGMYYVYITWNGHRKASYKILLTNNE
ncbi:MAG: T9SS type A sorting domain-containing protein, partial [Saprospiraceae bacterium]